MKSWQPGAWLKALFVGRARDLSDQRLFHTTSLVAILAWVGLGADGLSSSCYGPEETYRTLGAHPVLALLVALACVATIVVICLSYRQIIELFPGGGGGYLVASKLLSPAAGLVSGCALLVDYVLTISISIASGADALFSVLPASWLPWKLAFACVGVGVLTLLNLRGVRETVMLFAPVFFVFVATHAVAILMGILGKFGEWRTLAHEVSDGMVHAHSELGLAGMGLLLLRAYSLGAGTYTGIEAVSNGLPVLREPRVVTGKRTMTYMGVSLAATVFGLLFAYVLYHVQPAPGKTLNAVLFEQVTTGWPAPLAGAFVTTSMLAAMALLFVAAQAGFLDGPRVMANMALDRWFPARFATLSDRFVTQNGILLMGGAALAVMLLTRGAVALLVVLYSINVFMTFTLSQAGMTRHWLKHRGSGRGWKRRLAVSTLGFSLCAGILMALSVVKFHEGGWVTLLVTAAVIGVALFVRAHYRRAGEQLRRLDELVADTGGEAPAIEVAPAPAGGAGRTAIVLVNGYNGLGLHTFFGVLRLFPATFSRFVFVQIGVVDAGTFKGAEEIDRLRRQTAADAERFGALARRHGFAAEIVTDVGHDLVASLAAVSGRLADAHPEAVFFGGQLAFQDETHLTRWLHNYTVFALQRIFCRRGVPFVIVPARV